MIATETKSGPTRRWSTTQTTMIRLQRLRRLWAFNAEFAQFTAVYFFLIFGQCAFHGFALFLSFEKTTSGLWLLQSVVQPGHRFAPLPNESFLFRWKIDINLRRSPGWWWTKSTLQRQKQRVWTIGLLTSGILKNKTPGMLRTLLSLSSTMRDCWSCTTWLTSPSKGTLAPFDAEWN